MCQPPTGQMVFSNVSNENVHGLNLPSLDTMYQKKKKKQRSPPLFWKTELLFTNEKREKKRNVVVTSQ